MRIAKRIGLAVMYLGIVVAGSSLPGCSGGGGETTGTVVQDTPPNPDEAAGSDAAAKEMLRKGQ